MFESAVAQPIFPTYLWIHDLKPAVFRPLNSRVIHDLDRMTKARKPLAPGHKWQTDQTLHEQPEFAELVRLFRYATGQVLDTLEVEHQGFRITGCWANIAPKGGVHVPHHHPNNYLSGVYYVHAEPGADTITFHEPRPQTEIIAPRLRRTNQYNTTEHTLQVKAGRLVIFPAWLVHSVSMNESDHTRISISFNVMFENFEEVVARPKWTGIPLDRGDTG